MRARNCTVYNFKYSLRYFGLDQSGGPTDFAVPVSHATGMASKEGSESKQRPRYPVAQLLSSLHFHPTSYSVSLLNFSVTQVHKRSRKAPM